MSFRRRSPRRVLRLLIAALLALSLIQAGPANAATARAADIAPAGDTTPAVATAPLALVDRTEDVGPGVSLHHLTSLDRTGWYDDQVLTVDLSNPVVSTDLLTSGSAVTDRGPISQAADRRHAVAATNGDFFDIDGSGAPIGTEVQDGMLLKSQAIGGEEHAGVGTDGLARLVDATVDATADVGGELHRVLALNTSNGASPTDALVAFTPLWGTVPRIRGLQAAGGVVEVLAQDGKVVSVTEGAGTGAIPAGAFVLLGRGAEAQKLRMLRPGDPASLSYTLKDDVARSMKFVVGGNKLLVRNGMAVPQTDRSVAPRTALGIKDGGKTLLLVTTDGRQTLVPGRTLDSLADEMLGLGAQTALNLDGGGSTTMVARALGDPGVSVRNKPSDGAERSDPNGVGVFVAPGSGRPAELQIRPDADAARIFPGLHRTLNATAVDDHRTPVRLDPTQVHWRATGTTIDRGVLVAPTRSAGRRIDVRAHVQEAAGERQVRVLGAVRTLEPSRSRLSFPEADPRGAVHLDVIGRDSEGFTAPIELRDLELDYDHSVLRVEADGYGLRLVPLTAGGTLMTLRAAGVQAQLPVSVGVRTSTVYTFDHADEPTRWAPNGTVPSEQRLSLQSGQLRLDYSARRNEGISFVGDPAALTVPGEPLRVRLHFTASNAMQFSALRWVDAAGIAGGYLGPAIKPGRQAIEWSFPAGTRFPVRITQFQAVETDALKQKPGSIVFDRLEADNAPPVEVPAPGAPLPDGLVSPDGRLPTGQHSWNFATLSDVQFTAADPELAKVGVAALERIKLQHPDLVVLNGDITDQGAPQDIALARQTLEKGGCDLIKVGEEKAADSTPDPASGRFPCYYVPGNHESYRASGQGDLAPFVAEFGRPYRTFDHKGTRMVLLNSALGTLRGSDFDQLPMLQQALQDAEKNSSVHNVMVFAHHPVDDPAETKSSQLGDRMEAALVEKLLTAFREKTGKGAAMVGSHAQIMDVHRIEGVPYTVLPSSGKAPYGTPDRGGFTGFLNWSVNPDYSAQQQWLTADVRAFAQSVSIDAPARLAESSSAEVGGSIVQPSGVRAGTRVVPLRYPMSVHWSGSDNLAIGSGPEALRQAHAAHKVALLDPQTRRLTGLRAGEVTLRVTNESMREFTGEASLAPIVAERQVVVTGGSTHSPKINVAAPVFPTQTLGTLGAPQQVEVANDSGEPAPAGTATVDTVAGSTAEFRVTASTCPAVLAPGQVCRVWTQFAPTGAGHLAKARLVLGGGAAVATVDLVGRAVPEVQGAVGPDGAAAP